MEQFPCTRCGACCKSIRVLLSSKGQPGPFSKEIDAFPYEADADGACEKLVDGLCSVYENRPDICNVATMRERMVDVSDKDFVAMTTRSCGVLIDSLGIDPALKPQPLTA